MSAKNKIYYTDDLCLDPFKTQEINSLMGDVRNERSQAKLRSPIFQQTNPILQNNNYSNQVVTNIEIVEKKNFLEF